ncbi:MAG: hypothetical protein QGG36_22115 [Pirellulaceae bacterium]|jgi:hypothetical protein|nr:hypothetical protein [Pirellulaceae bacterium]MDP7018511.1 hypothetical protein [Pirellulaceae bacterium]
MTDGRSTAERSLDICQLFEAEVLLHLLLTQWQHPLASDDEFRNALLESATDALRSACDGARLIDDIPPHQMNFIAAVWCVESQQVAAAGAAAAHCEQRLAWLDQIQRALPSCFCNPELLM